MNETPERICEALEWLTGHKWADNGLEHGKPSFACSDGDQIFSWDSEDGYCLHRGWFKRNIEEEFAHALEVTAPWEWKDLRGTSVRQAKGEHFMACVGRPDSGDGPFCFSVHAEDIRLSETGFDDIEQAQTTARTAYLTWTRGQFAMKGCMA